MKKIILGMTVFIFSMSAFAGSNNSSQTPPVSAEFCVGASFDPFTVGWVEKPKCRDAIDKGYAKGIGFSGIVSYGANNQSAATKSFVGKIKPGEKKTSSQLGVPETFNGHKLSGLRSLTAYWY